MLRDTELELRERLLAHLESGESDGEPPACGLPVSAYLDQDRYRREVARLFERRPVPVAHEALLPEAGDYATAELGDTPLLLSRGEDGKARAFVNVCRHRGTRLAREARGRAKSFVCPYHGWTYGRDGCLLGVPHRRGFPGLDLKERPLVERPLLSRGGLLFVAASGEAEQRPDEGGFTGELGALFSKTPHLFSARTREYRANWKIILEGALENYHVKRAHADTIYSMFLDNLLVADHAGADQRLLFPRRSLREVRAADPNAFRLREHANLVYMIFPNTLALVQDRHATFFHVFPLGLDRVRVSSYTLIPEAPETERARDHWGAHDDIMYAALDEDFAMAESIQSGLRAGANEELQLGSFESCLRRFHDDVERALGA